MTPKTIKLRNNAEVAIQGIPAKGTKVVRANPDGSPAHIAQRKYLKDGTLSVVSSGKAKKAKE